MRNKNLKKEENNSNNNNNNLKEKSEKKNGENLLKKSGSNYNSIYPTKNTMNLDAVNIPDNYISFYNINTYHKQSLIGNKEYLDKKELTDYIGGNSSFISIPIPPHINL